MTILHVRTHHVRHRSVGSAADRPAGIDVAAALERADLPETNGLWFIDRIALHVCARDSVGDRASADLLAGEVARALRAVLNGDRSQGGVRWFPDRTDYLAHWLTDLSTGHAGERWEYATLGAGDFSSALRERSQAEPGAVRAALRSLPDAEIDRMIELLTPSDAAVIVHAVGTGAGSVDRVALAGVVSQLWRAARLPHDPRRATLAVLLQLSTPDHPPNPASAGAIRDLVMLCAALRQCDPAGRGALLAAARTADARTLAALGHHELAAAWASWPDADRRAAVAVLAADTATFAPQPERTRLGGLFLLLPLLAELPLVAATEGWPVVSAGDREHRADAAALIGGLAIGAVLGVGVDVLDDPWALLALGLPRDIGRHVVAWSNRVTELETGLFATCFVASIKCREAATTGDLTDPSLLLDPPLQPRVAHVVRVAAAVLARELSHRLPGQAHSGLDYLRRNVLRCGARVGADHAAIVVELDPPPLAVLLSLTGMDRRRFTLPATGERPWVLTRRS